MEIKEKRYGITAGDFMFYLETSEYMDVLLLHELGDLEKW